MFSCDRVHVCIPSPPSVINVMYCVVSLNNLKCPIALICSQEVMVVSQLTKNCKPVKHFLILNLCLR